MSVMEPTFTQPFRSKPWQSNAALKPENLDAEFQSKFDGTVDVVVREHIDDIPDCGFRAWSVVLGSFCVMFSAFGVISSFGVFYEYYTKSHLPRSSLSAISLIGALQLFFLCAFSPLTGRIFDAYGTRLLYPLGTIIVTFSLLMASLTQKGQAYQVFLSHGVLFGIGSSFLIAPCVAVLGHWFHRKRAYVIGIACSGSPLGGLCFPILLQHLIPSIGFGWAVRVLALVVFSCLIVACLVTRTRLPLKEDVSLTTSVDFSGFKQGNYILASITAFFMFSALFIPPFYIESYANFQGVNPHVAKYQLATINAFGILARIIPSLFADRFGPLNVLFPTMTTSFLLILGLWLPSRDAVSITLFSAFFGLFSGAYLALIPAYIAVISPPEKFGARLGAIFIVQSVAALTGAPTAGAFVRTIDQAHFNHLIVFTGILVLLASVAIGAARLLDLSRHPDLPQRGAEVI